MKERGRERERDIYIYIEIYRYRDIEIYRNTERRRQRESERERERQAEREAESLTHLSVHQRVRSAVHGSQQLTSPTIGFLSLKLPPPSCAVLLVENISCWFSSVLGYAFHVIRG